MSQRFDDVIVPHSVTALPAADRQVIYQAKDLPADEASRIDERYHDGEAPIYDTYCLSPRVALAERWIVAWLRERARGVVVDLGCGTGRVAEALIDSTDRVDRRVVAVDRSLPMLEQVQAKLRSDALLLLRSDARALPLHDSCVDTVICSGVLHHMPAWSDAVREIGRILRTGGRLLVREPNERYPAWLFAPFESVLHRAVDHLNHGDAPPAGGDDSAFSPVERPIQLGELTKAAAPAGLRLRWSGSAMGLGSLDVPDGVPFSGAYFTAANLVDRLAMRLTRHPYGALVLAVYVKS